MLLSWLSPREIVIPPGNRADRGWWNIRGCHFHPDFVPAGAVDSERLDWIGVTSMSARDERVSKAVAILALLRGERRLDESDARFRVGDGPRPGRTRADELGFEEVLRVMA